jgi:hypothetical protein
MVTTDTNRATMTAYVSELEARGRFAEYFTDDVELEVVGTDQRASGRQAVEATIRFLHEQAFDGLPAVRHLLIDGDHALLEADFVARQILDFAGRQPTGKSLRVPYAVAYDLTPDGISALRIYGFMDVLLRQLDSAS